MTALETDTAELSLINRLSRDLPDVAQSFGEDLTEVTLRLSLSTLLHTTVRAPDDEIYRAALNVEKDVLIAVEQLLTDLGVENEDAGVTAEGHLAFADARDRRLAERAATETEPIGKRLVDLYPGIHDELAGIILALASGVFRHRFSHAREVTAAVRAFAHTLAENPQTGVAERYKRTS